MVEYVPLACWQKWSFRENLFLMFILWLSLSWLVNETISFGQLCRFTDGTVRHAGQGMSWGP